mgnify:CR=1 FL=1
MSEFGQVAEFSASACRFCKNRSIKARVEMVGRSDREIAKLVGHDKDQIGADFAATITKYANFEHLEAEGRRKKGNDSLNPGLIVLRPKSPHLLARRFLLGFLPMSVEDSIKTARSTAILAVL